ncbi:phenylpyruvate tautomerase MIF-related protein [Cyanobacterium aponinum UTEX 3221]|uniref:phenylpyruvate tautomerase MIF-related protein n=1 Tax=Cyanobacterium aponinum TaxID=379064 RepID=UPI002B4BC2AA|nr:phenylpyruvate tautomerase MIF-related protein [Cyanobacterium aponinum]WRL38285.1 phenylpyruvate tautomerase MIF-related protein [Cyanobacterium aponinum UTEX 3221]
MPLIKVQTSIANPDQEKIKDLLKNLSNKLAKHLGKPESYVMTIFESDLPMSFAGTFDPVCYLEIKSVGTMSSSQTKTMSEDFCNIINDNLGVSENRIYIEFADAKGYLWGWNGSTF